MIEWKTIVNNLIAVILLGILSCAWLTYNQFRELAVTAPIAFGQIAEIKADMKEMRRDISFLQRQAVIRKESKNVANNNFGD